MQDPYLYLVRPPIIKKTISNSSRDAEDETRSRSNKPKSRLFILHFTQGDIRVTESSQQDKPRLINKTKKSVWLAGISGRDAIKIRPSPVAVGGVGGWSAGRSVGGDGAAAPLAEVGDAVHALVHGRVHGERGLDAVPARRVAPAGRRVHAPALRRVRLGAPPAAVAARPRAPPRLRRRRRRRLLLPYAVPSVLDMRAVAVVVVVPAAGFGEGSKSCEDDGEDAEDQQQLQRRAASSSSHLCLSRS